MPTVQQLAAKMNHDAAEALTRNAQAMPADKHSWKPLDAGRTALDQIAECAVIAGFATKLLTDRQVPEFDQEAFAAAKNELDTLEKGVAALKTNTDALVTVIRDFPTADLDNTITLPWFTEPQTFAQIMFINYWNNTYHIGQLAYIQTLYGDKDMH